MLATNFMKFHSQKINMLIQESKMMADMVKYCYSFVLAEIKGLPFKWTDPRGGVFPHWLPTTDAWCQQLCSGWADTTTSPPHAPSVSCGHWWQSLPPKVPEAGSRKGAMQQRPTGTSDASQRRRYVLFIEIHVQNVKIYVQYKLSKECSWIFRPIWEPNCLNVVSSIICCGCWCQIGQQN